MRPPCKSITSATSSSVTLLPHQTLQLPQYTHAIHFFRSSNMVAISTLAAAAAATLTMHQHILTPNTTSISLANVPQSATTLENMLAKPTCTLPIDNPSATHSSDRTRSPPRPRFCAYDHDWVLPCLVGEVCKPVKDSLGQDTLFSQCVFDSTVHGGSDRIHVEEDHPENQQPQSELPTMRGSPLSAQAAPAITTTTTTTVTAIASSNVTTTLTSRVRCTTAVPDADRVLS